ncbi:MAG: hypothetical protein OEM78_01240 [Gammaproteobacteria bacterium]|nr:hypothetical protein [Gammaproteobacteria bacterium]
MIRVSCTTAAFALLFSGPAFAQRTTWSQYVSEQDYFAVSFPGEPSVEEIVYPTEYRIELPGRVYSYENNGYSYSVTAVDYRDAVEIHLARNARCIADGGDGDQCQDDGPEDVRGAIVYASWNLMNRDGVDVTHYAHYNSDRVEGHDVRLTNPDGSRTSATVHMHEDRLYIFESTVPPRAPAPGLFQISVQFLDEQYQRIRYDWVGTRLYSNGYPAPPRVR